MPIAEMRNISKVFKTKTGTVQALKDVSLSIEEGSFTVILGKSGSGKSTLLNILGFMDDPTSGKYYFDGEDVSNLSPDQKAVCRLEKIGFVFQQFNLIYSMTAFENIELPLGYRGIKKDERRRRVNEMLEFVGLSDRSAHKPGDLSGGQQQRVAIARALINDPAVILADEPTGNLDKKTSDDIIDLFVSLNEQGRTIVMVTHDPEIAGRANKVYHMEDGKLIEMSQYQSGIN